jgi:hypothetical protein
MSEILSGINNNYNNKQKIVTILEELAHHKNTILKANTHIVLSFDMTFSLNSL